MTLPIELNVVSKTTKVTPRAWKRAQDLAHKHGVRISDIVSLSLIYMDEAELVKLIEQQRQIVDAMPKAMRGLLRNMDKLDAKQRAELKKLLSD